MDEIERTIVLPPEAQPLRSYARTYKFVAAGQVEGSYFVPISPRNSRFCADTKTGGRTNGQVLLACAPPWGLGGGQRRWLDDDVDLPFVFDGGCDFITILYDLHKRGLARAFCNGEV